MQIKPYDFSDLLANSKINKLIFADICSSTMDLATVWQNESEPVLIIAESQTSGRGQKQRYWLSPKKTGIWATIVIHQKVSALAQKTAIAIAESLVELGCPEPIKIKWPNDIYLSGKKTAGVLIEGAYYQKQQSWAIGIGITMNAIELEQVMPLAHHWPNAPDRNKILASIINKLFAIIDLEEIASLYAKHDMLFNKQVPPGIAKGINKYGQLIVQKANGKIVVLG